MNSIAVMQPYFFPYIGYFQMIHAVDKFIFYDDVSFIKNGWINRNRILINGLPSYLTIPCKDASSNKLIKFVEHGLNPQVTKKLLRKIQVTYSKAEYFNQVFPIIQNVLNTDTKFISELAIESVKCVTNYLDLECEFVKSSEVYSNSGLNAAERLVDICNTEGISHYVNPIGGQALYRKEYFKDFGIKLDFIVPSIVHYKQFSIEFVPSLSIIDVLMFNSKAEVQELIKNYNFT